MSQKTVKARETNWLVLGPIALVLFFAGFFGLALFINQNEDTESVASVGGVEIKLEVASSQGERMLGLSNRESLASDTGMLFLFDSSDIHGLWMKDMNFSLDFIWINDRSVVVDLHEHISPETYPKVFKPNEPVVYVIETNAGFVSENQIEIGDDVILSL